MSSGFWNYDFVGHKNYDPGKIMVPWGFAYWMSRKVLDIMADTPLPQSNNDEAWVGRTLYNHGIFLHHDERYHLHIGIPGTIDNGKRALRVPRDYKTIHKEIIPKDGTFAFCMYMTWLGYRKMPAVVVLKEFKKVFEKYRET
jgi:hypothetical protein